jgi:hypothetical protein
MQMRVLARTGMQLSMLGCHVSSGPPSAYVEEIVTDARPLQPRFRSRLRRQRPLTCAPRRMGSKHLPPVILRGAPKTARTSASASKCRQWNGHYIEGRRDDRSSASPRAGFARHDPLIQFLIHDLDRAVDLGIGDAKLMRNQLHQQVDPLNERRSIGHRPGR